MKNRISTFKPTLLLCLCLCLGSLAILPIANIAGFPMMEIAESSVETFNSFEQTEADDDFVASIIPGVIIAGLSSSKSKKMRLGAQSASLSPLSPPPKPA